MRSSLVRFLAVSVIALTGIAVGVGTPRAARAAPITYTFSGIGSGDFGNATFTNTSFSFTLLADTNFVFAPGGSSRFIFFSDAIFTLGGTSGTLTDGGVVNSDNAPSSQIDFRGAESGPVVGGSFTEPSDLVSDYDAASTGSYQTGATVNTSQGQITFGSLSNLRFTASLGAAAVAAPEPGTLVLVLLAALPIAGVARRRKTTQE